MLQFEWPLIFLLAPVPALAYFFLPAVKEQSSALRVPFYQTLANIGENESLFQPKKLLQKLLAILLWLLLIAAAARPQWVGEPVAMPTEARDLLLAVDLSLSMDENDMEWNGRAISRIELVKIVVSDFVSTRVSDRLSLILFGENAYVQAPLTFDRETVGTLLKEAQLGFAGRSTAIGDAIGLAIKRLQKRPESSRVLILLTDGQDTASEVSPTEAAKHAKVAKIKIYTIGVASDKVLRTGFFGQTTRADRDLDENTLQYIARTTGGQYFRARNAKELQEIYAELNELEPIDQEGEIFRPIKALFFWPLAAAFIISLALSALRLNFDFISIKSNGEPN